MTSLDAWSGLFADLGLLTKSVYETDAAIDLIKRFEGLHLKVTVNQRPMVKAYYCPAHILTIGYGHVLKKGEPHLITEYQAESLLKSDMQSSTDSVLRNTTWPLTTNQLCALLSFTFNVGSGNFRASTLLRKLNRGDINGAAEEFPKWRYAGGKILPGLIARRLAEKTLFLS